MSAQYNKVINPELMSYIPEVCPYKYKKQSNQNEEEEEKT
jgi:hypothetical protein